MSDTVMVTGGTGYVASHLVDQLLSDGDDIVHATVRSLADTAKVAPLTALQDRYPGRLALFEADLLRPGSFGPAMAGCAVVYHVASPFMLPEKIHDGRRQLLEPALHGTRNVLGSVGETPTVRRVVLTSTVGAIFGDYSDVLQMAGRTLTEAYWNETSTVDYNPYHYSKVVAEKEAWRICGAQARWSMVAINPGLVLGPSFTPASDSGSLSLLDELMKGYFCYGAADLGVTVVDVRDVARAHIRAARCAGATGRYIVSSPRMYSFLELARMIRPVHRRPYLLPRHQLPDSVVRLLGPRFGLTSRYIRNHVGIRFAVDNRRGVVDLGVTYRPVEDTVREHYLSWAAERAR